MTRLLHELGFLYLKGETSHIYAESEGNVAFRSAYLSKKLADRANIPGNNGSVRLGVDRPEVLGNACIIVAGIIRSGGAIITGGFVENSIRVWNSTLKRGIDGEEDYHGNFNAELFERWFEDLCQTLQRYGGCNIYMDGAAYHKRDIRKSPRKSWLKADTQEWLRKNVGMVFSPKATIDTLLQLVEFCRPAPLYMAVDIAAKYGHRVCYTPPYQLTLQPIKLIWGTVKNRIAKKPAKNGKEVVAKVIEELEACKGDWLTVYRHVQKHEDAFVAA
ncbi:hypothetical protein PF003_g539 [Phytophthora fragariae]|nr:hypothetical protein PF003_g539 [Phytophthora fragariae]